MIKIFYGDDRIKAQQEIKRAFKGDNYEIIDATDLTPSDLPTIFYGASLFEPEARRILLRDFTANKSIYDELPKYLDTPHDIILLETKLDKRSAAYKSLKDQIIITEFKLPDTTDFRQVFDIYKTAKRDGKKALEILAKIKPTEDPIKFTGLLVSQAVKDFAARPTGTRERNILKALAHADLNMKSTKIDPWLIVESFLLELSSLK